MQKKNRFCFYLFIYLLYLTCLWMNMCTDLNSFTELHTHTHKRKHTYISDSCCCYTINMFAISMGNKFNDAINNTHLFIILLTPDMNIYFSEMGEFVGGEKKSENASSYGCGHVSASLVKYRHTHNITCLWK